MKIEIVSNADMSNYQGNLQALEYLSTEKYRWIVATHKWRVHIVKIEIVSNADMSIRGLLFQ